jgi:hypothetical protein
MRPEPSSPADRVRDLLAHADALAGGIASAIADGEDAELTALLDQRATILDEISAALPAALASPSSVGLKDMLAESQEIGDRVLQLATLTRQQVQAELAQLDAQQHASNEYQSDRLTGSFSVIV